MEFNIFIPSKRGHYKDYSTFLKKLLMPAKVREADEFKNKLRLLFSKQPIIFLDIDNKDILWALLRSFFSSYSYGVSVSAEDLLNKRFSLKLWKADEFLSTKYYIKFWLLRFLKRRGRLKLISIHKGTRFEKELDAIASLITYDFQYYDLDYMQINAVEPAEMAGLNKDKSLVLIFNNTSTEKKNLPALKEWILTSKLYSFIIVGNCSFLGSNLPTNVTPIERYVSNEEMIYLMQISDLIYCYYANERPSGFMGRAMQLNKEVIVLEGSYLHSLSYPKAISVTKLDDISIYRKRYGSSEVLNLDDSKRVKDFLNEN